MKIEQRRLGEKGSSREAKLTLYLQEMSESLAIQKRPLILICPGGGYEYTSDREAEPLAMAFLAMGYHAAVLRYSTEPATRFPTALLELAASMAIIRKEGESEGIERNKVFVLGCSAGGHLAASLGAFWNDETIMSTLTEPYDDLEIFRPDGLILCYPVITSGEFAHRGSFQNLLGDREAELGDMLSIEKQVTPAFPPSFIWHTFTDGAVPVENSLMMATALRRAGVSAELHVYAEGGHGLALANHLTENPDGGGVQPECESWIPLVHTWLQKRCGF